MVYPQYIGGLGNCLFQLACGIGYSQKYGLELHSLNSGKEKSIEGIFLEEKDFSYEELIFDEAWRDSDIFIKGYRQSYKYWKDYSEVVLNQICNLLRNASFRELPSIKSCTVSIHVRRGDYLAKPDYHPVVTNKYLDEAIYFFQEKGYKKFLFFSDDISWCKKYALRWRSLLEVDYSENKPFWEDMMQMSTCEHNIIANSSFSWWGAYLNPNPDKIVIVPKNWFGKDGPKSTKDLIPENWIQL